MDLHLVEGIVDTIYVIKKNAIKSNLRHNFHPNVRTAIKTSNNNTLQRQVSKCCNFATRLVTKVKIQVENLQF